jgi:hypothetical protein
VVRHPVGERPPALHEALANGSRITVLEVLDDDEEHDAKRTLGAFFARTFSG